MTPRQFYRKHEENKPHIQRIAAEAGTTFGNFQQIALYGGACSKALAKRLEDASGSEMTRNEILFPEEYEKDSPETSAA
jgi:hypothetical protein